MPKIIDRQGFIEHINELFHDPDRHVGELAIDMVELIEGEKAQDVMCALSFLVAYIIDSSDNKRETLDEFARVVSKFIHFDAPAFKPDSLQ